MDAQVFRKAWSKFATGVSVVTVVQPNGQVHGMTANGIASVSLDPLLVMVCVGNSRTAHALIREQGHFAINVLSEDQEGIADYHARSMHDRQDREAQMFRITVRGGASLDGCLAYMDCHVVAEHPSGDHTIFVGEVDEIQVRSGRPLMFFEGRYCRF